ncbi:hypothetical protein K1T71_010724 [Dendrolimus kikuchii]|uniref:Uncharacterized protein n=1 Tax=Dendrolimus kikuchii TaxID=765133 RepID=A0ACC1CPZ1_9NEOP|nr:hypothetical protein K1T71_010724 [Dendrolimus kikuchii]
MTDDVEFDEFCDPNNPRKIKYDDILAASQRIVGAVVRTPITRAHMSEKVGMDLYLKHEFMQFTGSFKERGVRNTLTLLSDEQKKYGVISASSGNHGAAMCYHTTLLGIPCVIVMPIRTAVNKINRCQRLGGKIILHGASIAEAKRFALTMSKEKKMTYVNGYDHPNICEGQGTVGIEILEQLPAVDAVLIPVGGGSLLCGVAVAVKHLKPETEVYGVETDKTCSMSESLRKHERIFLDIDATIADGLAVNMVGVNTFYNVKGVVDKMVVVKEDWVPRAILNMVEQERFIVEGAGATTVAAVMAGLFPNLKGKKVVCILSGGNIDTSILGRSLERAMAADGRLLKFKVSVIDRPGSMADLCELLCNIGVAMRDCVPERAWINRDVFTVQLKVVAETRGWDHTKELIQVIKSHYKECSFLEVNAQTDKRPGARRGPCLAPNPICMQK